MGKQERGRRAVCVSGARQLGRGVMGLLGRLSLQTKDMKEKESLIYGQRIHKLLELFWTVQIFHLKILLGG